MKIKPIFIFTENIIEKKSFDFAIRIVKLYKYLCEKKKEFFLSKQLLRSGTSIGAADCVDIEKILTAILKTSKG